jgi:hypothetical protein
MEIHVFIFRLGAEGLDLFEGTELGESVQSRFHDSLRIIGTHGLREDVFVTSHLKDGTDTAAGDETSTRGSRTEHDDATIGVTDDFVRNRVTAEIDADESAVGAVSSLADCIRNFLGLAIADTDSALAIPSHDERSKVEATATFDDLRATIDMNDLVVIFRGRGVVTVVATRTTARATGARTTAARTTRATRATTITARSGTTRGGRGSRSRRRGSGSRGGFIIFAHVIRSSGQPCGRRRRKT